VPSLVTVGLIKIGRYAHFHLVSGHLTKFQPLVLFFSLLAHALHSKLCSQRGKVRPAQPLDCQSTVKETSLSPNDNILRKT